MLKERLGLEASLIQGSGGIFEVAVDGRPVIAKSAGGFPSEEAVVAAVAEATGKR